MSEVPESIMQFYHSAKDSEDPRERAIAAEVATIWERDYQRPQSPEQAASKENGVSGGYDLEVLRSSMIANLIRLANLVGPLSELVSGALNGRTTPNVVYAAQAALEAYTKDRFDDEIPF